MEVNAFLQQVTGTIGELPRKSSSRMITTAYGAAIWMIDNSSMTMASTASASGLAVTVSYVSSEDEEDGRIAMARRSEANGPSLAEVIKKYGL